MLVALLSYKSCNVNLSAFLSLNMVVECHSVLFVGWVENPDLKLLFVCARMSYTFNSKCSTTTKK